MEVDKPMIKKFIIYVVSVKSVNTNWNFTLNSHTQVIALCFQQLEKHSSKLHFSATHFDAIYFTAQQISIAPEVAKI